MGDIIDRAAKYTDAEIRHGIRRAQQQASAGNKGSAECADCGEDIPEARRCAVPGCTRCVACQEAHEKNK
ncbi:MAG: TraR/DksA family transcriptional regulator [Desulfobacteraceae bacterium]|nr:TraR/DksA family transcriptional regulator [Desulfobacteraceae bacterium]